MSLKIEKVNESSKEEFIKWFETIIEHHPKCAELVYEKKPFGSVDELVKRFQEYLDSVSIQEKEEILQNYPLLGKTAEMTKFSVQEHKSAGLDRLEVSYASTLSNLNQKYSEKFGFPFIICARENDKTSIVDEMKKRCEHAKEDEILNGIEEVKKIAKHRLHSLLK